jgi:hypothetical protein
MTTAYEGALRVLGLANRTDPITEIVAKKCRLTTMTETSCFPSGWSISRPMVQESNQALLPSGVSG